MNYLYCNGRLAPAVSCDALLKARPRLPNAFDLIPAIDGLIIGLEFCMWLHVIWFPQGFFLARGGRTLLPHRRSRASRISLLFGLRNQALVRPAQTKGSGAEERGKSEENRRSIKGRRGSKAGSWSAAVSFWQSPHWPQTWRQKGQKKRTEEVASRHCLKCSRVYRKPLQRGKEKLHPSPRHSTDGMSFTSRRDGATNSPFKGTKSHSVLSVWNSGVKPSTSCHLSVTSGVGSGVSA